MAIKKIGLVFLLIHCWLAPVVYAQNMADKIDQQSVDRFLSGVRCLVCAGESLATSSSPFANNLRDIINEQFAAGKSEGEVRDFLRVRYGDAIFFRPPFDIVTWGLWLSPILLLLLGLLAIRGLFKRR